MSYQCSLCSSFSSLIAMGMSTGFSIIIARGIPITLEKAQVYMKHSEITQSRRDISNKNGSSEFFNNSR